MKIDQEELNRRAAEADRARLVLRRATLELIAVKEQLLEQHKSRQDAGRFNRSDNCIDRDEPGV
jgi:hypothetical protein